MVAATEPIDIQRAHETLREDPHLGPVVDRNGLIEVSPAEDFFRRVTKSVVRQQISMTAAAAIFSRLDDAVDLSPTGLRRVDTETLHAVGLSQTKVETLRELAATWEEQSWDRHHFAVMDDTDVIDALTTVHGIGPWTAKMTLLFGLGRPDVWPVEDLGVRRGMERLFDEELTVGGMNEHANRWRPYRSVAALHLWKMEDG